MPRHLVIRGHVVTTVEEVLEHYEPRASTVPPGQWRRLRPLAVASTRAADCRSAHTALFTLKAVTQFLAWAEENGHPLDAEAVFTPDLVERFCALRAPLLSSRTVANYRSALRRAARASTVKAPWAPPPRQFSDHVHLAPPYTEQEVHAFWDCARSQATEHRQRVMTTMLTLGLGAGLRVREVLALSAEQHVRLHPRDERLCVLLLEDRLVPVLSEYTPVVLDLCRRYPQGPLIGSYRPNAKDPMGVVRKNLEVPSSLPRLSMSRLRTTWMASVLMQPDIRISEFMVMAGTVSSKTLECIAPFIPYRAAEDEYLFKGAGL